MENNISDSNLTEVQKCVERLQTELQKGNVVYIDSIRSNTSRLLLAISGKEKACKYLSSKVTRGFDILISLLENIEDVKVVDNVCLILKKLLSSSKVVFRERCRIILSLNGVHVLLRVLANSSPHSSDEGLAALYNVLAKIGNHDRKFPIKARLMGTLSIAMGHIKIHIHKAKVLQSILRFFHCTLNNNMNATFLGKEGLISILLSLIDGKQKNSVTLSCALETLAAATRSKVVVLQIVQLNGLGHLLLILDPTVWSKFKSPKLLKIFRHVLQVLVRLTYTKNGREALTEIQVGHCLLQWCQTLPVIGDNWNKLATLASLIIQRCLPPLVLPVPSFYSPVFFPFPEETDNFKDYDLDYHDKQACGAISDDNMSSCNSEVDSDSDENEDSFPNEQNSKTFGIEEIQYYKRFFPELQYDKNSIEYNIPSPCENSTKLINDLPSAVCQEPTNGVCNELPLHVPFECENKMAENTKLSSVRNPALWSSADKKLDFPTSIDIVVPSAILSTAKSSKHSISFDSFPLSHSLCRPNSISTGKDANLSHKEVKGLLNSAKEEKKREEFLKNTDIADIYTKMAGKTKTVLPTAKLAFPDMHGSYACDNLEPLHQKHPGLYRLKVLQHAGSRLKEQTVVPNTVYDLDDLIRTMNETNCTSHISNDDIKKIGQSTNVKHLQFESRFESGNLRKVIQVQEREYNLILNPDINTTYHHQWFYFQVSGMVAQIPYTFNIINCEKANSLFNNGMNPLLYSVKEYTHRKKGWTRAGWDICYYRNHYTRDNSVVDVMKSKPYYTLTFTIIFPHSNDVCYLAYHYPYTFSLLQTHLYFWGKSYDSSSVYFLQETLCESVAGNPVSVVTITALPVDNTRQYIFLTGRVHPGESNSSWVMKGTLDFILSNKPSAKKLRENFIFKIVPMLNPDGVINGCYRCSLSGQDLNRQWLSPCPTLHPTIYNTKALLFYLQSVDKKPMLYCDYHGHSRKQNIFLYGCSPSHSWWSGDRKQNDEQISQVLPLILHHVAPAFNIENCSFTIEKNRESTARITVWRQFGVALSYTMECTYGGCDQGIYEGYHLGTTQIEEMGMKFCQALGKLIPDADSPSPKSGDLISLLDPSLMSAIRSTQLILFNKKRDSKTANSSQSEYDDEDDDDEEEEDDDDDYNEEDKL